MIHGRLFHVTKVSQKPWSKPCCKEATVVTQQATVCFDALGTNLLCFTVASILGIQHDLSVCWALIVCCTDWLVSDTILLSCNMSAEFCPSTFKYIMPHEDFSQCKCLLPILLPILPRADTTSFGPHHTNTGVQQLNAA